MSSQKIFQTCHFMKELKRMYIGSTKTASTLRYKQQLSQANLQDVYLLAKVYQFTTIFEIIQYLSVILLLVSSISIHPSISIGSILRISCLDGPQAGDLNLWNAMNYKEHFYTGKTRQLHRSHLSLYDKLWSCFPYLNPMATIVGDSIMYGIDKGTQQILLNR